MQVNEVVCILQLLKGFLAIKGLKTPDLAATLIQSDSQKV